MRRSLVIGLLLVLVAASLPVGGATAAPDFGSVAFEQAWNRLDRPVASGQEERTWIWGPDPLSGMIVEPYDEGRVAGRTGSRRVLYFDKGRMEITGASADDSHASMVSSGLLTTELITGRIQMGDDRFAEFEPAEIPVVGDGVDSTGPTYADLAPLMDYEPIPTGWTVSQILSPDGSAGQDTEMERYGVTAAVHMPETNHTVASVFWEFLNSSGTIYTTRGEVEDDFYDDLLSAIGLPITEAYWTTVDVNGVDTDILIQAFERRLLTYTPGNPDAWQIELNNVGRHYFDWRYGGEDGEALTTASVFWRPTTTGGWIVLGEVRNETRAALSNVEVTVDLFGRGGEFVASQSRFLDLSTIVPGEALPFRVWFDPDLEFERYDVHYRYSVSPDPDRVALTLESDERDVLASGPVRVTATVRNDGMTTLTQPAFIIALYDESGRVVDYSSGLIDHPALEPGQSASIDATFYATLQPVAEHRIFTTE